MSYNLICRESKTRLQFQSSSVIFAIVLSSLGIPTIWAQQTFGSGSSGADGPLNITSPGLTYFDPAKIPNHHAGDTIFNFTTITIAAGSTLRLDATYLPGPVYWLATGDVNIAGTVDLNGAPGHNETDKRSERLYSIPGAGGYAGGPGGSSAVAAEAGAGPGGGAAANCSTTPVISAKHGNFSGSQYLVPLNGGSGGGGACLAAGTTSCGGGGAGGGAILIASSSAITISGVISAKGGTQGSFPGCGTASGFGSGGAVRLVSNMIGLTDSGVIDVSGASEALPFSGFLRLESYQLSNRGRIYRGSVKTFV